jgi:hypothetical protein
VACSLTYDSELSRVRIDADSLCVTGVVDTYSRTVTGSWSSADTGQAWTNTGGSASDYSVSGGFGLQNNITENVFRSSTLNVSSTDCDFTISVKTDKVAAGASQAVEVIGRAVDTSNHYGSRITYAVGDSVAIDLRRRVAGVVTTIASVTTALTHVVNTFQSIRFSVQGSTIKVKIWNTASSEPDAWTLTGTDTVVTTGTLIGVRSVLFTATSNEPVVFSWDNLRTAVADHAVVERSTDGVTYTTVRGATDVGVTTGCELEQFVDDYEFPVGVQVTYRVRGLTSDDVAAGSTTCQITVNLDDVWLKSIGRPFLNQVLHCVSNPTPIVRRARNNISPIVGRSYPVAVTDLRGSREVTVPVITQTTQEREDLDLLLASGDPVFIQTPAGHPLPTMYAVIEDTTESRPVRNRLCNNDWRLFELPMVEVAAPGPDVVGSTGTWQTVVNTYATWADVIANNATWADLLNLIGDGSEVLVP